MGFRLSGQLLETKTGLTPAQKLILLGLCERADRQGRYAFPSVATLAQYAECSERTVELGLQALVAGGWIAVQRKATNRLPTTYVVILDKLARGEESSPQAPPARGEETSPQENSRGELFDRLGANFSTARGEETSPDPVSKEPILEPIQGETAAPPRPSPAELVDVWNAERYPGPRVEALTPQRTRAYQHAIDAHPNLDDWRTAIGWLNGQAYANAPGVGVHPTWRASLDWLAKPGQLAKVLESARTDAWAPPGRPRRLGDMPSLGIDDDARQALAKRREAYTASQAALEDEAARLVLELSDRARQVLEREALVELERFRPRMTVAQFDDVVCRALPARLIKRANGRPLVDVVAELEKGVAA